MTDSVRVPKSQCLRITGRPQLHIRCRHPPDRFSSSGVARHMTSEQDGFVPPDALVDHVDGCGDGVHAPDRSQPMLPMVPGVPERRSHDCIHAAASTPTFSGRAAVCGPQSMLTRG